MKVYSEISLEDFQAWSGGLHNLNILKENPARLELAEAFIEEKYPDTVVYPDWYLLPRIHIYKRKPNGGLIEAVF